MVELESPYFASSVTADSGKDHPQLFSHWVQDSQGTGQSQSQSITPRLLTDSEKRPLTMESSDRGQFNHVLKLRINTNGRS